MMVQLILKQKIDQTKLDALLYFLKSWDIDAEVKTTSKPNKKQQVFSETFGMWKDREINAKQLREQAATRF